MACRCKRAGLAACGRERSSRGVWLQVQGGQCACRHIVQHQPTPGEIGPGGQVEELVAQQLQPRQGVQLDQCWRDGPQAEAVRCCNAQLLQAWQAGQQRPQHNGDAALSNAPTATAADEAERCQRRQQRRALRRQLWQHAVDQFQRANGCCGRLQRGQELLQLQRLAAASQVPDLKRTISSSCRGAAGQQAAAGGQDAGNLQGEVGDGGGFRGVSRRCSSTHQPADEVELSTHLHAGRRRPLVGRGQLVRAVGLQGEGAEVRESGRRREQGLNRLQLPHARRARVLAADAVLDVQRAQPPQRCQLQQVRSRSLEEPQGHAARMWVEQECALDRCCNPLAEQPPPASTTSLRPAACTHLVSSCSRVIDSIKGCDTSWVLQLSACSRRRRARAAGVVAGSAPPLSRLSAVRPAHRVWQGEISSSTAYPSTQ